MNLLKITRKIKNLSKHKDIVMCHGVYDFIHLGHIEHFKQAKLKGDILVVSITDDKFVEKGQDRPFFRINERIKVLSAIKYIDYVVISKSKDAVDNINLIKPKIYCKGPDYKILANDTNGMLKKEVNAIKRIGGEFYITKGRQYSSSKMINSLSKNKDQIKFVKGLNISPRYVRNEFENIKKKNILVIGEGIIDKYTFAEVLGKSGKDPIMNYNIVSSKSYCGGAISIAANLSNFCKVDTYISVGDEKKNFNMIKKSLSKCNKNIFFKKNKSSTPIKNRFVDNISNQKFFGIYEIDQKNYSADDKNKIINYLRSIKKYDLIIAPDFGNNFLFKEVCDILKKKTNHLSFTTQINSTSLGFSSLNKFKNSFSIFLNEKELRHEFKDRSTDIKKLMKLISKKNNTKHIIVTRGKLGSIWYEKKYNKFYYCPAFARDIIDKTGSGDTLYAISSLLIRFTKNIKFSLYAGSMASVNNLSDYGNKRILEKNNLLKSIIYSKV